jgi:hypothetical protein
MVPLPSQAYVETQVWFARQVQARGCNMSQISLCLSRNWNATIDCGQEMAGSLDCKCSTLPLCCCRLAAFPSAALDPSTVLIEVQSICNPVALGRWLC